MKLSPGHHVKLVRLVPLALHEDNLTLDIDAGDHDLAFSSGSVIVVVVVVAVVVAAVVVVLVS